MSDPNREPRYFRRLEQPAFMRLEHAASLKGLLKPFKGKGDFEAWASQCFAMRDELIALAQRQVLPQACGHPFHLLPVELAQQTTGAGTTFLRWRKHDRSAMGVALWQELMASPSTPVNLLHDPDVSGIVAFLASDRALFITGQTIGASGGFAMV